MYKLKMFLYELNELCIKYGLHFESSNVFILGLQGELKHNSDNKLYFYDSDSGDVYYGEIEREVTLSDSFENETAELEYYDLDYDCI